MNCLLKGEFPNAALGNSTVAWIGTVDKGNAIDTPHLGSGAEAWVICAVLIELTGAYVIGIFEWCWHTIERVRRLLERAHAKGFEFVEAGPRGAIGETKNESVRASGQSRYGYRQERNNSGRARRK